MKWVVILAIGILLNYLLAQFLPWWAVAIPSFIAGMLFWRKLFRSFLVGSGMAFLYAWIFSFLADVRNQSLLSEQMASILPLGGNSLLLIIAGSIVFALVGGMASCTGTLLRQLF